MTGPHSRTGKVTLEMALATNWRGSLHPSADPTTQWAGVQPLLLSHSEVPGRPFPSSAFLFPSVT